MRNLEYAILRTWIYVKLRSGEFLEQEVFICEGEFHERMTTVDFQFLTDVIAVSIDCARANKENLGRTLC